MHISPVPWGQLLILGGTVLLIYTLDRLLDVQRMQERPVTVRHAFHQRFRCALWVWIGVLLVLLAVLSIRILPGRIWLFGLMVASLVGLYLLLVNRLSPQQGAKWFHKEIIISVLYTAGVWGNVRVVAPGWKLSDELTGLAFGIIAFQNLILFSAYEMTTDIAQTQRSIVLAWGQQTIRRIFNGSAALVVLVLTWTGLQAREAIEAYVLITLLGMEAILCLLCWFPSYFHKNERYRWIGDGIFLLPIWLV